MPKRWVSTAKGPKQVDAVTVSGIPGVFINRDVSLRNLGWVITHRASGLFLGSTYFHRRRDAIRVLKAFTEEYEIDWTIKDPTKFVETYFGVNQWFKDCVEEYCHGEVTIH